MSRSFIVILFILFILLFSSYLIWGIHGQQSIHPSVSSLSTLPALEVIPMTPGISLTSARVISFVGITSFAGGQTVSGNPPTILLCQELTSQEATRRYKLEDMPDDNRMVVYLQLHGPFIIPHLLRHNPKMPPVQNVEEVFDATNGQILDWGVLS